DATVTGVQTCALPILLSRLRQRGVAADDAFAVGATLTIPLHQRNSRSVLDELAAADVATSAVATRKPTLDDVYLQLTGDSLAARSEERRVGKRRRARW